MLSFSIMTALLVIGFARNERIRPVKDTWHEHSGGRGSQESEKSEDTKETSRYRSDRRLRLPRNEPTVSKGYIALAWSWVAVPFSYGFLELLIQVRSVFAGG